MTTGINNGVLHRTVANSCCNDTSLNVFPPFDNTRGCLPMPACGCYLQGPGAQLGLPCFVIIKDSPRATRSNNCGRCVFASKAPIVSIVMISSHSVRPDYSTSLFVMLQGLIDWYHPVSGFSYIIPRNHPATSMLRAGLPHPHLRHSSRVIDNDGVKQGRPVTDLAQTILYHCA